MSIYSIHVLSCNSKIIIIIIIIIITKGKASDYFSPHQFGVACPSGAEKIVHGLRSCIEEHQNEHDFVVMKIDLCNAFNLVSHQALLDDAAHTSLSSSSGLHGAMVNTHCFGLQWEL